MTTTRVEQAEASPSVRLGRQARQAAWATARAKFPPRPVPPEWLVTQLDLANTLQRLGRPPFVAPNDGTERHRWRGVNLALAWLNDQPGDTWQQRWVASGAEPAAAAWKQACPPWLDERGVHVRQRLDLLSIGVIAMIGADLVRPSVRWLASPGVSTWALARNLQATRDRHGFASLQAACQHDQHTTAEAAHATVGRAAILVAAKGGTLDEVTVGDLLELLDIQSQLGGRSRDYSAVSWRLLHQLGILDEHAPKELAQLRTVGQRSPADLIDRYRLACRPVRDLLVDYLHERQPALDHNSLESLAQQLGRLFWADLERHHPGIDTLNLPAEVASGWKHRLRVKTTLSTTPAGGLTQADSPRLTARHTLTAVRALYLDLAQWALEDPARWAPWVAPCPVGKADLNSRKETRHRKSRMDARTRERLPLLPVLIRHVTDRRIAGRTAAGRGPSHPTR